MSAREELAQSIATSLDQVFLGTREFGPAPQDFKLADALLAEGWGKQRTVATVEEPVTRTYGHGGIKLTAYLSSGRVGIEVTAENAVMDWWELVEFVDHIRELRIQEPRP